MTQRRRPTPWPQPDASDGRPPGLPGPPDDGSRPLPGDEEPPPKPNDDPPPPNSDECRRLWAALRRARQEVTDAKGAMDDIVGLSRLVGRYQDLKNQAKTLHDEVIMPLQNEELPALREAVGDADAARAEAGCIIEPDGSDQSR